MQGQRKEAQDRPVFPEGVYPCTLSKAFIFRGKPTKFSPEGNVKMAMVWTYQDDEGTEFELADFNNFPKNLKFNEKSNYWARLSEIAGVIINNDNVETVVHDLGLIETWDELTEQIDSKTEQGNNEKVSVTSIKVGDTELIGVKRQLVVKIWQSEGREGNEVANVLGNKAASGPQKPGKTAPAAAAKAGKQEAVLTAPAAPKVVNPSTDPDDY